MLKSQVGLLYSAVLPSAIKICSAHCTDRSWMEVRPSVKKNDILEWPEIAFLQFYVQNWHINYFGDAIVEPSDYS